MPTIAGILYCGHQARHGEKSEPSTCQRVQSQFLQQRRSTTTSETEGRMKERQKKLENKNKSKNNIKSGRPKPVVHPCIQTSHDRRCLGTKPNSHVESHGWPRTAHLQKGMPIAHPRLSSGLQSISSECNHGSSLVSQRKPRICPFQMPCPCQHTTYTIAPYKLVEQLRNHRGRYHSVVRICTMCQWPQGGAGWHKGQEARLDPRGAGLQPT